MKTTIVIILLLLNQIVQAQEELKLKFVLENSSQVSSSLIIGRDFSATTGIDEDFNEEDLYGTELDKVDIRSIQRTEQFHECLTSSIWNNSGDPFYFENNRDLRIDIRSMDLDYESSCFEIKLSADEYPLNLNTTDLKVNLWCLEQNINLAA